MEKLNLSDALRQLPTIRRNNKNASAEIASKIRENLKALCVTVRDLKEEKAARPSVILYGDNNKTLFGKNVYKFRTDFFDGNTVRGTVEAEQPFDDVWLEVMKEKAVETYINEKPVKLDEMPSLENILTVEKTAPPIAGIPNFAQTTIRYMAFVCESDDPTIFDRETETKTATLVFSESAAKWLFVKD